MPSRTDPEPTIRTFLVPDEAGLAGLAAAFARVLPRRAFVALSGDLGAGKTTFVKWVMAAVGVDPADVVSPTFGLIHEHAVPGMPWGRIVHADLYRLGGVAELSETGWDDAIAAEGWVFVEWPERIAAALPTERFDVEITVDSPFGRTLTFRGREETAAAAVAALDPAGPPIRISSGPCD